MAFVQIFLHWCKVLCKSTNTILNWTSVILVLQGCTWTDAAFTTGNHCSNPELWEQRVMYRYAQTNSLCKTVGGRKYECPSRNENYWRYSLQVHYLVMFTHAAMMLHIILARFEHPLVVCWRKLVPEQSKKHLSSIRTKIEVLLPPAYVVRR